MTRVSLTVLLGDQIYCCPFVWALSLSVFLPPAQYNNLHSQWRDIVSHSPLKFQIIAIYARLSGRRGCSTTYPSHGYGCFVILCCFKVLLLLRSLVRNSYAMQDAAARQHQWGLRFEPVTTTTSSKVKIMSRKFNFLGPKLPVAHYNFRFLTKRQHQKSPLY